MCVFFKQKRAYELRISDWSSDVCSSDLIGVGDLPAAVVMRLFAHAPAPDDDGLRLAHGLALPPGAIIRYLSAMTRVCFPARQRSAQDRKSDGSGKSVSVRVDLGGRRRIKKKKSTSLLVQQNAKQA